MNLRKFYKNCWILVFFFCGFTSFLNARNEYSALSDFEWKDLNIFSKGIVTSVKKIEIPGYPRAYNPSIIKLDDGYLLTFRYSPEKATKPWISYVGVVTLDDSFNAISPPQLLNTRLGNRLTPSQAEDARIFLHEHRLYIIYNDNTEIMAPNSTQRRDIYLAELVRLDNNFVLAPPVKLIYGQKYQSQLWQKNWVPFEWNRKLLFVNSINPHEILQPDLDTGVCTQVFESPLSVNWRYGTMLGGTPAIFDDDEYFSFFYSTILTKGPASSTKEKCYYFMGAYAFHKNPPFRITKIIPCPLIAPEFYSESPSEKRVISPGGCLIQEDKIHIVYGKDEESIWMVTLSKPRLKKVMKSIFLY